MSFIDIFLIIWIIACFVTGAVKVIILLYKFRRYRHLKNLRTFEDEWERYENLIDDILKENKIERP